MANNASGDEVRFDPSSRLTGESRYPAPKIHTLPPLDTACAGMTMELIV